MPTTSKGVSYDYPIWANDDINKIIVDLTMEGEPTKTILMNSVKDRVIKKIANMSLEERFEQLVEKGYLCFEQKTKTFKVIKLK
jgi:hypothetical protein